MSVLIRTLYIPINIVKVNSNITESSLLETINNHSNNITNFIIDCREVKNRLKSRNEVIEYYKKNILLITENLHKKKYIYLIDKAEWIADSLAYGVLYLFWYYGTQYLSNNPPLHPMEIYNKNECEKIDLLYDHLQIKMIYILDNIVVPESTTLMENYALRTARTLGFY